MGTNTRVSEVRPSPITLLEGSLAFDRTGRTMIATERDAIWPSTPPVALIDDLGRLAAAELGDVDLALPFTGRRWVTVDGSIGLQALPDLLRRRSMTRPAVSWQQSRRAS